MSKDFPDTEVIRSALQRGLQADPETIFVVRVTDDLAISAVESLGRVPVLLGLNPHWKYVFGDRNVDDRSKMREQEILRWCNIVLVFTTPTTKTLDAFKPQPWLKNLHVITRGKQPVKKHRKGRKPTGA